VRNPPAHVNVHNRMNNSENKIDQMSTHSIAMRLLDLAADGGRHYEFPTEKGVVGVSNMADYPGDDFIYIGFEDIADNWLLIVHASGDTDNDIRRGPNETAVPEHEYKAFMRTEMMRVLEDFAALENKPKITAECPCCDRIFVLTDQQIKEAREFDFAVSDCCKFPAIIVNVEGGGNGLV